MMKKMSIMRAAALMCMAVFLLFASGCPNAAKKENHTPNPEPDPAPLPEIGEKIPEGTIILSIETAVIGEKGNTKNYAELKNFNRKFSGPYEMTAETAYIALKVKAGEKPEDKDFSITVENMNTYERKVTLKRGQGADDEYFVLAKKDKKIPMSDKIPLSKGKNTLVITITPPDGSEACKYFVEVDYAGVSDETGEKIIPGIYCPAPRKPSEGEKEEKLWVIFAAGFCGNCTAVMTEAGKLMTKYKEKGLRVICVSVHPKTEKDMFEKRGKGDYPIYNDKNNFFYPKFYSGGVYVPNYVCIIKGRGKGAVTGPHTDYEAYIKNNCGF